MKFVIKSQTDVEKEDVSLVGQEQRSQTLSALESDNPRDAQHIFQTLRDKTQSSPLDLFQTREEVYKVLATIPVGSIERRLFLTRTNAGELLTDIGSNVTLYTGEVKKGESFKEQLAAISVLLISRRRHDGTADGLGALGGLSEIIQAETFQKLSFAEQKACVGEKDNVVLQGDKPCLIKEIDRISRNNVKREVREELQNIGITTALNFDKMERLPFQATDDDYVINRWNYGKRASVVKPQCYVLQIPPHVANMLTTKSAQNNHEVDSELFGIKEYPLTHVLFRSGHSKTEDYRYPHEWLSSWFLAAKSVKGSKAHRELAIALQQVPDFEENCIKMRLDPQKVLQSIRNL